MIIFVKKRNVDIIDLVTCMCFYFKGKKKKKKKKRKKKRNIYLAYLKYKYIEEIGSGKWL